MTHNLLIKHTFISQRGYLVSLFCIISKHVVISGFSFVSVVVVVSFCLVGKQHELVGNISNDVTAAVLIFPLFVSRQCWFWQL